MEYYCGIDLGTSSVKVMLLGADGTVVGTASAGYDIKKNTPWEAEQDMEYLWQQTRQSITALLGKYPGTGKLIRGISFSGQMHGMVAVDKNGRPVRDAVIWADQRSRDAIDHIWDAVSEEEWKKTTLIHPAQDFSFPPCSGCGNMSQICTGRQRKLCCQRIISGSACAVRSPRM